jgi:hypothetical protein
VQDGEWLDADSAAAALVGGETYRIYSAVGEIGTATGGAPESAGVPCADTWRVALSPEPTDGIIALGGDWSPLPRVPADDMAASDEYQEAIAGLLRADGLDQPEVRITQALRVDLEGDGSDEILLSASRLAEPRTTIAVGDYSLVAIVRPGDGGPEATKIAGEVYLEAAEFGASNEYEIAGALDLNGDGVLEVIIDWSYYEGAGSVVFAAGESGVTELMGAGCGA